MHFEFQPTFPLQPLLSVLCINRTQFNLMAPCQDSKINEKISSEPLLTVQLWQGRDGHFIAICQSSFTAS